MSGTSGSVSIGGGGVMLPAPKVQIYIPQAPAAVFVADGQPSSGVQFQVSPSRFVKVTVPGIPSAILSDISGYLPLVELLRFTRLESPERMASGNGTKTSAYVHPSHGPAASGDGSFTHGGVHAGTDPAIQAIRPTEWLVTSGIEAIDVTQGILGFMCHGAIAYRDPAGNSAFVDAVYPSGRTNLGKRNRVYGRRYPYTSVYTPGYFAFRLSVVDRDDPRGKRIHGPMSTPISVSNAKFPFIPAGIDIGGRAQADLNPSYDSGQVNFWLGSTSRLPG